MADSEEQRPYTSLLAIVVNLDEISRHPLTSTDPTRWSATSAAGGKVENDSDSAAAGDKNKVTGSGTNRAPAMNDSGATQSGGGVAVKNNRATTGNGRGATIGDGNGGKADGLVETKGVNNPDDREGSVVNGGGDETRTVPKELQMQAALE